MIKIDDNGLFQIFPAIESIATAFEYQNSMLNKIVLTGKINALNIAENLFEFTEKTAETFAELQTNLIENLLEENKKNIFNRAKSKAETAINILTKNLYQRVSDIEFLSKDDVIIDFLKGEIDKNEIEERLKEFQDKYSIYNEIMILNNKGLVRANLDKTNKVRIAKEELLLDALKSDSYIQAYKKTDLYIKQKKSLFFIKRVENGENEVIGFVVLFFNLKEEMKKVFNSLIKNGESITLVDKRGNVIVSSEKGMDKNLLKAVNKVNDFVISNNRFHLKTKTEGYKGYVGENWYSIASLPREKDINVHSEFDSKTTDTRELTQINIKNKELKKLADDGYAILEDLSDVIINGELIAAKSKQYILIPILDNLREVSFKVVKLIEMSIYSLQKVINESLENDVTSISNLIIDIVQRELYERTNDIRWWGLNKKFQKYLEKGENISEVKDTLQNMVSLYSVYDSIFIYDKNGKIVASSNPEFEGELIDNNFTSSNIDSEKYFVSEFQETKFYNNRPTYIFYASITNGKGAIGGIGAVFNAEDEFNNILKHSFQVDGFALLVNSKNQILSSTSFDFQLLDEFKDIELKDGFVGDITIKDKEYKISISQSNGYREYENKHLFSVVCIEK